MRMLYILVNFCDKTLGEKREKVCECYTFSRGRYAKVIPWGWKGMRMLYIGLDFNKMGWYVLGIRGWKVSIRVCMYFRDLEELEQTKVFLSSLRGKRAGLSDGQVRKAVEAGLGNTNVADGEQVDQPSNSEREIPVTLRPFISQGWDLDTAFRIYDEWRSDMNGIKEHTSYVKPLFDRFAEEREKQYANEGSK